MRNKETPKIEAVLTPQVLAELTELQSLDDDSLKFYSESCDKMIDLLIKERLNLKSPDSEILDYVYQLREMRRSFNGLKSNQEDLK